MGPECGQRLGQPSACLSRTTTPRSASRRIDPSERRCRPTVSFGGPDGPAGWLAVRV